MARAVAGDRAATDALLRLHYDTVRAVCHRIVINRADADDATQQALMSIVRALPGFDGRSRFSTWAYRIATNAAIDEVRRIRRRALPTDGDVLDSVAPAAADHSVGTTERMAFESALARVAPEYREVLVMRHVADMEYSEIAVALDIPVGTVRSRLARGRSQLVEMLGNPDGSPDRHNVAREGGQR